MNGNHPAHKSRLPRVRTMQAQVYILEDRYFQQIIRYHQLPLKFYVMPVHQIQAKKPHYL